MKRILAGLVALLAVCNLAFSAVDLNSANQQQLETINGLGPSKAKAIVEYRSKNGAFKTIEDVMKVPGIKQGVFSQIKSEITISNKQAAVPAKK